MSGSTDLKPATVDTTTGKKPSMNAQMTFGNDAEAEPDDEQRRDRDLRDALREHQQRVDEALDQCANTRSAAPSVCRTTIESAKPPSVAYVVTRLSRQQLRPFGDRAARPPPRAPGSGTAGCRRCGSRGPRATSRITMSSTGRVHGENRTAVPQRMVHRRSSDRPGRGAGRSCALCNQVVNNYGQGTTSVNGEPESRRAAGSPAPAPRCARGARPWPSAPSGRGRRSSTACGCSTGRSSPARRSRRRAGPGRRRAGRRPARAPRSSTSDSVATSGECIARILRERFRCAHGAGSRC